MYRHKNNLPFTKFVAAPPVERPSFLAREVGAAMAVVAAAAACQCRGDVLIPSGLQRVDGESSIQFIRH